MSGPRAQRIHIVGGPGSGKSTVARQLGQLLPAPVYGLDSLAYAGGAGPKRDRAQRRADVEEIAESAHWITEGICLWWCDPLATRAEQIVWLDVPSHIAIYRIIRRHIVLSLAGNNPHAGVEKLVRFVWACGHYYHARTQILPSSLQVDDDGAITRAATQLWLGPHATKVTRCETTREIERLLANHATLTTRSILRPY